MGLRAWLANRWEVTFIKLKCSEKLEEKCRATSFLAPSIVCKKQRKLNIEGKDVFVEFYLGGDYKVIFATINSWSRSLMSVFQKLKYNNLTIYFIVIYFSKYSTALHFLFSSFYWYWEWKELHQITHVFGAKYTSLKGESCNHVI